MSPRRLRIRRPCAPRPCHERAIDKSCCLACSERSHCGPHQRARGRSGERCHAGQPCRFSWSALPGLSRTYSPRTAVCARSHSARRAGGPVRGERRSALRSAARIRLRNLRCRCSPAESTSWHHCRSFLWRSSTGFDRRRHHGHQWKDDVRVASRPGAPGVQPSSGVHGNAGLRRSSEAHSDRAHDFRRREHPSSARRPQKSRRGMRQHGSVVARNRPASRRGRAL